jgi:hypothetical protein
MSFQVSLYQIQKEGKVILKTQVVLPSVLELFWTRLHRVSAQCLEVLGKRVLSAPCFTCHILFSMTYVMALSAF